VQIKSTYGAKLIALGVIVRIPVPPETAKATINISIGKAKYNASESCIVWKVRTPTD
jgi:AP-2 complex subunit mu-1